jgi:RHS repeat-associated protein
MLHDANSGLNYTWDQENRLTGANGFTYTYDGDGNRVRKSNGNLAANGTLYWYMTPGVVAETDLAGTTKSEYIFFDGERVARRDGATGTGGVFYYFSDHLKTASVITDSAGVIKAESDYYPWGGELQFVNNDTNDYKFTGKKRDVETSLDYFGARYYSNGLGRFLTPDKPFADQHLQFPQSWNLYMYVYNNPLHLVDDTGQGARPADDPRVQQVLNRNENFTIKQAILASPNYSAWALEREIGRDSLSSSLVGVAGEAEMSDRIEARNMFSFTSFQPHPTGGGQPDILLTHTNADSTAVLTDVVGPKGQLGGMVAMETGPAQIYFEVKTSSDFGVLMTGAQQTAATAASIPAGQNSVAVLAVDQGAWQNLSKDQQKELIKAAGGGFIQLHKNLISDALKRAHKLKNDVCKSTNSKCQ